VDGWLQPTRLQGNQTREAASPHSSRWWAAQDGLAGYGDTLRKARALICRSSQCAARVSLQLCHLIARNPSRGAHVGGALGSLQESGSVRPGVRLVHPSSSGCCSCRERRTFREGPAQDGGATGIFLSGLSPPAR
jgi:hypothetical protein